MSGLGGEWFAPGPALDPGHLPRHTNLTQAEAWLRPALAEPLRIEQDPPDWWPVLRIELLLLASAWLDIGRALADAEPGLAVASWRTGWWRQLDEAHRIDRLRRTRATVSALLRGHGRGELLKTRGQDLRIRRIATPPGMVPPPGSVRRVFLAEIPTPSMMAGLLHLAEDEDLVVAADPRCFAAARRAGLRATSAWRGRASRTAPRTAVLRRAVAARLSVVDPRFAQVASSGTARLWRQLISDSDRVRELVARVRPRSVVVASDQHRYGVLACWAADALGVPSVVLQHGVPVDVPGFTPLRAGHYLTFGAAGSDFFLQHGAEAGQVHAVGLPRTAPGVGAGSGSHLLVPLQPVEDDVTREMVGIVASLEQATILRLHPGDSLRHTGSGRDIAAKYGWSSAVEPEIDRDLPLRASLARATCVITHDSTVAVEAAQLGIPVFVFSTAEHTSPLRGQFPDFGTPTELRALVREARRGEFRPTRAVAATGEDAIQRARGVLAGIESASGS